MKYRPEVDGLRAIAVLSVLIYHAKFSLASGVLLAGGYLGVDIFFVISGYLITKIIVQDIRASRFRYLDFYERRARRILPALFLVMLVSLPFAWHWMLPEQLIEYARSILGAIFFSSNFVFLLEDSYTAAPSALKPFLHTWSLGIEEQFYILLPLILFAIITRFSNRALLFILFVVGLTSLSLSQVLSANYSDANFFILPTRAWELLLGSMVAILHLDYRSLIDRIGYKGHLCFVSLVALIISLFLFNDATPHPSLLTLIPVAACGILICFGDGDHYVRAWLSNSGLVSIGLISYSLYLWHFPLFAFYRLQYGEPDLAFKFILLGLSFLLAFLSYRWVEKPFRNRNVISASKLLQAIVVSLMILLAVQVSILANNGHGERLGDIEAYVSDAQAIKYENGAKKGTSNNPFVVLGDSHARVFSHSVKQLADKQGRAFVQMVRDGCPFVDGVDLYQDGKLVSACRDSFDRRLKAIDRFDQGIYFYSGRFALYKEGQRFAQEPGYPVLLTPSEIGMADPNALLEKIKDTLGILLSKGIKIVLVYPIPEMGFDVPKRFVDKFGSVKPTKLKKALSEMPLTTSRAQFLSRSRSISRAFDEIKDSPNLIRLRPVEQICDAMYCYAHDENHLYYYDDNHLSPRTTQSILELSLPELKARNWID